jgi:hypothetical protein
MDKKQLSERDICTKYITPALEVAGWDIVTQIRDEFPLTKGRVSPPSPAREVLSPLKPPVFLRQCRKN